MRNKIAAVIAISFLSLLGSAAQAQVQQAAGVANRALWGSCGTTIKAALQRQDGVAEVIIDQQRNIVFVKYKPNIHFVPMMLRKAAAEGEAGLRGIQIVAVGHVIKEGDEHFLIAGEDRFRVVEPDESAEPLPASPDAEMLIVASIDDRQDPILAKIVKAVPNKPAAADSDEGSSKPGEEKSEGNSKGKSEAKSTNEESSTK